MPRPKGSKNRPKLGDIDRLEINHENFLKLQGFRSDLLQRIEALKAEVAKVDKAMLRFADWMEAEAQRLRKQAKGA